MASSKKGKNRKVDADIAAITREAARSFSKESFKIIKEIEKKNESQRKLLENRGKAKTKEARDQIDEVMDENTRKIKELMEEYNGGVASFWEEWTKEEREAFKERSDLLDEAVNETEEAIDKIHGRLRSSIEDVTEDLEDNLDDFFDVFEDRMSHISDQLREWSNALNLTALVDSTKDTIDSYMENIRQMRVATGSWFDEKEFSKATSDIVQKNWSYTRAESSEFLASFMNEFALKQMEQTEWYSSELASATKAFGNSVSDYENLLWKDKNEGYQGRLVRGINNIAGFLEDDQYLNVKGDAVVAKINESIGTIIGLHAGDEKRQKGLIKSVAAIEAIQQSAAVEGMGTLSEKITEWSRMSIPELQEDENFLQYQALTGIRAKDFYDMASSGSEEDLKKIYLSLYDSLNALGGDNEYARQYNLHAWTQALGFSDYADLNSLLKMNREDIVDYIHNATNDVDEALKSSGSIATEKENESVTELEKIYNHLTDSEPVKKITDFFSATGISDFVKLSNMANISIIGSGAASIAKGIGRGVIGKKAGKGFWKSLLGFGDEAAAAATSAEKAAGKGGLFSKIKGLFKAGSSEVDDVARVAGKGGFFSKIKNFFKVGASNADDAARLAGKGGFLSKLTGLLENTKLASLGSKFGNVGKVAGKAAGPLTAIFAFLDGIGGAKSAKSWTGGNKLKDKISSFFGGVLAGTGPGLGEKGSIGDKLLNLLGGAGKGAVAGGVVGSVVPVIGTSIGAVVGAVGGTILSAIGGKRVSKFFSTIGGKLSEGASSAGASIQKSWMDFNKKIPEWKTSMSEKWSSFTTGVLEWKTKLLDSIKSLVDGIKDKINGIKDKVTGVKEKVANSKVGSLFGNVFGRNKVKEYANGLSEVPFDNYPAFLHKGESVLTASQSKKLKDADGGIKDLDSLLNMNRESTKSYLERSINNISNMVDTSKFKGMSVPELQRDKDFLKYSALTGVSAKEFYDELSSSTTNSLLSMSQNDLIDVIEKAIEGASDDSSALTSIASDIKNKITNRFIKEDKDLSRLIRDFNENGLLGNVVQGGASGVLSLLTKGIFGSSGLGKDIANLISGKGTGGSLMTRLKKLLGGDSKNKSSSSSSSGKTGTKGSTGTTGTTSGASTTKGSSGLGKLAFHPDISGSGAERWRPYVIDALEANELKSNKSMQDKVIKQIKSESGGDPKAINNTDINAKNGTPSKGLLQVIDPTFNKHKFSGHSNIWNGYDNMLAAIHYAKGRYGNTLMNKKGMGMGSGKGYAVGTPFVPNDQVALIHQGEMIVPADQNPMNNPTTTMSIDKPATTSSDNTQVIETMKWQVSRLEGKLDKLISVMESKGTKRRMPREASDELNEAFSSVKRPGMGVL